MHHAEYFKKFLDYWLAEVANADRKAKAANLLGSAYYYSGDYDTAEKYFRDGAGLNANSIAAFLEDMVVSLTMLGKTEARQGKNEQALAHWNSALKMAGKSFDRFRRGREEQADVLLEVGRFYVGQNNPADGRRALEESLQLRLETQGPLHPRYADTLRGLAGIAAIQNDLSSATLLTSQSLGILNQALVPTHPRIASTLVSLGSIHILSGKPESASPLNERLEMILQKPLGPWKEDFLETADFYADLLKKSGKTTEAESLEHLRNRQQDRR